MNENIVQITKSVSIPTFELSFRFARGGGPGGQHANRSATQVELLFDVANSPSLNETQRRRVLRKLETRIDKEGILHLVSQETRSQYRNREEVVERFQELMGDALHVPKKRVPTRPSRAARERRLKEKRHRSQKKRRRRPVRPDEY